MSAVGLDTEPSATGRQWPTLLGRRTVLTVAHTVTYAKRLVDILSLREDDFRIQVAFTAPPHVFGDGVPHFLGRLGCAVLPWEEAVRTPFDVAVAAGPRGVERLSAPLITLPHGASCLKRMRSGPEAGCSGCAGRTSRPAGSCPPPWSCRITPTSTSWRGTAPRPSRTPTSWGTRRTTGCP